MKKKYIILFCSVLFILYIYGLVLGSFDSTNSKKLGETDYYLVENVDNTFGLYYKYPDIKESFFGVLNACIKDVYWNKQYILITSCNTQNDSIKGYYIIKMLPLAKKGVPWKKIGPLSKKEYEQEIQKLNLNGKDMKHINILN